MNNNSCLNNLKFQRLLSSIRKERYYHMIVHIVECLIVSMEAAHEQIEADSRDLALSMYALYLQPFDDIIRNHPRYHEFESLYEQAVKLLPESNLECPCSVCDDEEHINEKFNA